MSDRIEEAPPAEQSGKKNRSLLGPGALVTAAFIGPGTVTACTLAGANFGYALIWALVFATVATIILQEMAARLGVVSRQGLGTALMTMTDNPVLRWLMAGLVLSALFVGNAAYEAGNLSGAALGVQAALDDKQIPFEITIVAIALVAAVLLVSGHYKRIERVLIGLVLVMAVCFVATAVIVRPDLGAILSGMKPSVPDGSLLTAVALIGTTIVPYNLFLHAAASRERWADPTSLGAARADVGISIGFGGLISILIVSTAASGLFATGLEVETAGDMAQQLEPVFGPLAQVFMAAGLFAAGLTSAITAPMATGYAVSEIFGWKGGVSGSGFRLVALTVIIIGAVVGFFGIKPVNVIVFAQLANGLLLPIIAIFLLVTMNRKKLLGVHTNGLVTNLLGGLVVLVSVGLGLRLILRVLMG
ncbi:Nramp family divalent metal transporter [Aquisalinus flavus]|uniref:Manganese transporter n=1 Tax=Aquisalinus flavus TaxID=1526572 RepID=A0A8J2Y8A4_9PROT|nr:Nramp family divalent metal transporter [Aquisalinus flavus]MBD0425263.1 Nramp family divalent metal transporter [Aquisalinus flavus]UNE49082.1 divalent metal cation transporter [Aquisalinus flavus]GGD17463.1 manganese transporter [Aquisalinus flavus]